MNCKEHAMLEFKACGWIKEDGSWLDDEQELLCTQVLELLDLFSSHEHSGSSATYAINIFKNIASFEPLVPLTGKDCEWVEVSDGLKQNKRCGRVFMDKDGRAYDIEGKVFKEVNGSCYTSADSRVYISFPYTPTTEYIEEEIDYDRLVIGSPSDNKKE